MKLENSEKEYVDINIEEIRTIVTYGSEQNFVFECQGRRWDGFVYFVCGGGAFYDSEGKKYELEKGSLILLRSGEKYKFSFDPDYKYIVSAYTLSASADTALAALPRVIKCNESQASLVESIYKAWQSSQAESYLECKIRIMISYCS